MRKGAIHHNRQISVGAVLSFLQIGLNALIWLIFTPVIIRMLGKSEYGLYNTAVSTISMLSVLNLGFGSGYIRYFSKYRAASEEEKIRQLNGLFLLIFIVIGIISFACGLIITHNLKSVFKDGLTVDELKTARVLMLLLTVNIAISFPMSVFYNIVSAHERFIFMKLIGMIKNILNPILTIPLLYLGYGSIAMVLVSIVVSLISDSIYIYYVFSVLKCRFSFQRFDISVLWSLFSYTFFIAINLIVDQINWNVDNVLLGRYQGTASVAIYSVGASLNMYYRTIACILTGLFTPYIHKTVCDERLNQNEKDLLLTKLFVRVGRIQYLILMLIMTGFVFWGKDFISFWAGKGYEESFYVALLLMGSVTIPLVQNIGIEIQRAKNMHQFRSLLYLGMVIVNISMTIILCQKYGAIGASVGTTVSIITANICIMNIYYSRRCGINIKEFWINILNISKGLLIPCIFGICLTRVINTSELANLMICILAYTIVYAISMWIFGMNSDEKKWVISFVHRIRR